MGYLSLVNVEGDFKARGKLEAGHMERMLRNLERMNRAGKNLLKILGGDKYSCFDAEYLECYRYSYGEEKGEIVPEVAEDAQGWVKHYGIDLFIELTAHFMEEGNVWIEEIGEDGAERTTAIRDGIVYDVVKLEVFRCWGCEWDKAMFSMVKGLIERHNERVEKLAKESLKGGDDR